MFEFTLLVCLLFMSQYLFNLKILFFLSIIFILFLITIRFVICLTNTIMLNNFSIDVALLLFNSLFCLCIIIKTLRKKGNYHMIIIYKIIKNSTYNFPDRCSCIYSFILLFLIFHFLFIYSN